MAEERADIVLSMATKLEIRQRSRESRGPAFTIFKFSDKIKEEYPTACEPQIVSIGPFHHDNPKFLPMEGIKWLFLGNLIGRHESNSLDKYINGVSDPAFVQEITKCYSKQVMGVDGRNAFVEIMVLDGCFMIEFLVKFFLREPLGEIDNLELVKNDLLLMENQIPFSVLQLLFNLSFVPGLHDSNPPFSIAYLSEYIMPFYGYDRPARTPRGNHQSLYILPRYHTSPPPIPPVIHHYLHLRHYWLRPTPTEELLSPSSGISFTAREIYVRFIPWISFTVRELYVRFILWILLAVDIFLPPPASYGSLWAARKTGRATELHKAGIIFKPKRASSILDVSFSVTDGVMEIPVLTFNATSMSQFRNLLALEQYLPNIGSHVTSFVLFMNCLINTPADVEILVESGVLQSKLGSEEVVHCFSTLDEAAHLDYDRDYLGDVYKDVKYYCAKTRTRWRARMINTYFTNPWTMVVLIQAITALMFSMLQSLFTVLAYVNPPKSKYCR